MRARLRSASARSGRVSDIRVDRTSKWEVAPPLRWYGEAEITPPLPEETDVPRPTSRAPLAHPGAHRRRAAHDRARPDDREHRAAERPEGPRLLRRRAPVDHHRVRAGLRLAAAA